eukprot:m.189518 g.189518  ORF g.189518 m.189518 type:complete len:816 (-) comp32375_c0_seq1:385-2832(-)
MMSDEKDADGYYEIGQSPLPPSKSNRKSNDDEMFLQLLPPSDGDEDENPFTVEDYRSSFGFKSKTPSRVNGSACTRTRVVMLGVMAVVLVAVVVGVVVSTAGVSGGGSAANAGEFDASAARLPCDDAVLDIQNYGANFANVASHARHCRATVSCINDHASALLNSTTTATTPPSHLFELRMTHYNTMDTMASNLASFNGLLQLTSPLPAMVAYAQTCDEQLMANEQLIARNTTLFDNLREFNTSELWAKANNSLIERYFAQELYSFTGALASVRNASTQNRIFALDTELSNLTSQFSLNIARDTKSVTRFANDTTALAGLETEFVVAHTNTSTGVVTFTTNYPDYIPVMHNAASERLRLEIYHAFNTRGIDGGNDALLHRIIAKRLEYAHLHNKTNYAELQTASMMTKNATTVRDYLLSINDVINGSVANELTQVQNYMDTITAATNTTLDVRMPYNFGYAAALYKEHKFKVDDDEVAKYFTTNSTREGIFIIAERLFGVTLVQAKELDVWHDSVVAYHVLNTTKHVIGHAYLDLYPRDNKYKHAAMFPMRRGVRDQLPAAALVCNFPFAEHMMFSEVTTFFHEFGHLMHFILGGQKQKWVVFSGMGNVQWDFVEAPSQMLEKWPMAMEVLSKFAKNSTGHVIPEALVTAIEAGNKMRRAIDTQQQIFYAFLSLELHEIDKPRCDHNMLNNSCFELNKDVTVITHKYSPFKVYASSRMYASFGHLTGYGPLYYTYQWSLGIAEDMYYSKFCPKKMMTKFRAMKYRQGILEPGGKKDTTEMITEYLGRPWSSDEYVKFLQGQNEITCARHHTAGDH